MPHVHDHAHEKNTITIFGFWMYILTDCILFSCLFATYAVLSPNTYGGPSGKELFSMPYVLVETIALLTSSFTYGLALLGMYKKAKSQVLFWLFVTFILGAIFIGMELHEFHQLIAEGNSWRRSAFLSAFFTLVGTHGLHVTFGLIWMAIMFIQVSKESFTPTTERRLLCLSLFWHFLDIIWICVFSIVYLMGVL